MTTCAETSRRATNIVIVMLLGGVAVSGCGTGDEAVESQTKSAAPVALAVVDHEADAFDSLLAKRQSRREFADEPLSLDVIGQLCWAGQGLNSSGGRTAPSAGALYPLTLFVVQATGTSRYVVDSHSLQPWLDDDRRLELQEASLDQEAVGNAAVSIVVAYDVDVTAAKYGARAEQYCLIEVGHVAQNILLKATALGLSAVPVGGFEDDEVSDAIQLSTNLTPAYVLAIGKPPAD